MRPTPSYRLYISNCHVVRPEGIRQALKEFHTDFANENGALPFEV